MLLQMALHQWNKLENKPMPQMEMVVALVR